MNEEGKGLRTMSISIRLTLVPGVYAVIESGSWSRLQELDVIRDILITLLEIIVKMFVVDKNQLSNLVAAEYLSQNKGSLELSIYQFGC